MLQKKCENILDQESTLDNNFWNLADYVAKATKEKLNVKIWSSKKYEDLEFLSEGCRNLAKVGRGEMIVGFLLCSLKFQSFKIGPIYGKNLDEIKAIIELTKFKVKEHKFKNENPNLRKGHLVRKSEILKIRKELPRDVVCYLDKFFSKKEAWRKNIDN